MTRQLSANAEVELVKLLQLMEIFNEEEEACIKLNQEKKERLPFWVIDRTEAKKVMADIERKDCVCVMYLEENISPEREIRKKK